MSFLSVLEDFIFEEESIVKFNAKRKESSLSSAAVSRVIPSLKTALLVFLFSHLHGQVTFLKSRVYIQPKSTGRALPMTCMSVGRTRVFPREVSLAIRGVSSEEKIPHRASCLLALVQETGFLKEEASLSSFRLRLISLAFSRTAGDFSCQDSFQAISVLSFLLSPRRSVYRKRRRRKTRQSDLHTCPCPSSSLPLLSLAPLSLPLSLGLLALSAHRGCCRCLLGMSAS